MKYMNNIDHSERNEFGENMMNWSLNTQSHELKIAMKARF